MQKILTLINNACKVVFYFKNFCIFATAVLLCIYKIRMKTAIVHYSQDDIKLSYE